MARPSPKEHDACDVIRLLDEGSASPGEVLEDVLERCADLAPDAGVFALLDPEGARAAAEAATARRAAGRPLSAIDGLPVTVKDLTDMRGLPTRKGSYATTNAPATENAPLVDHLMAAGAVIFGKTATPEFGWKGVTDSPLTGIGRNPWDPTLTTGGSSGGAAAAAVLGLGWLHQGSDAAGSIRIPCAFCGLAGLKPTFGRIPQWPPSAMGALSHLGPMARSVRDCAAMMEAVARPDPRDPTLSPPDAGDWRDRLGEGVAGRRVAVWRRADGAEARPEIDEAVSQAADALARAGAVVAERTPETAGLREVFDTLWQAGAARLLTRVDPRERGRMDPGLLAQAEIGAALDAVSLLDAEQERLSFASRMGRFHDEVDLILSPAVPIPAFAAGHDVPPGSAMEGWPDWTPFTYPFNLSQQPAASVPWGAMRDGRHIGLQVAGRRHADREVLAAAAALEAVAPGKIWPG